MAEGFYDLSDNPELSEGMRDAARSVVRLFTGRRLRYQRFETLTEAESWSGLRTDPDGCDAYHWGLTGEEVDALDLTESGPDWARGHLHELIAHLAAGGTLPFDCTMKGSATATVVSAEGHLLTNQHLVSSLQRTSGIPERTLLDEGHPAPHHRVETSAGVDLGPARLCYVDTALDLALLRLESPPALPPVRLRDEAARRHERVWQWGYPQLTRRPEGCRTFFGYHDASNRLCYSPGLVLTDPRESEWFTDCDAALGSSGAPVLDDEGRLLGLFWGGGAGGGWAAQLPADHRYRYRRVVDASSLRRAFPALGGI